MSRFGKSGHDDSLLSSMAARLRAVEDELKTKNEIIRSKDQQIHEMKVKLGCDGGENKVRLLAHLQREYARACKQIQEMEMFLADYGMVWVGDDNDSEYEPLTSPSPENSAADTNKATSTGTWNPGESHSVYKPDFPVVIHNIQELNILAGDGVGSVEKGTDGITRVVHPDPIPLTLYANGILMFEGPFRPYTDPATEQLMRDFQDGYFPSELQARYPKGFPIKINDLREKEYEDPRAAFPGEGQSLSDAAKELAEIRGYVASADSAAKGTEFLQTERSDRFLTKLPANVVRDGKIIDIRSSVASLLGSVTDVVKQIQEGGPVEGDVATVRVKMGDKTLIVKLSYNSTIGDLRAFITKHTTSPFEIRTTFPRRIYSDNKETLEAAGLTPSATVHARNL
eukprot:sb/3465402/